MVMVMVPLVMMPVRPGQSIRYQAHQHQARRENDRQYAFPVHSFLPSISAIHSGNISATKARFNSPESAETGGAVLIRVNYGNNRTAERIFEQGEGCGDLGAIKS